MTNLMTRALGGATALAGPLITFDVASIRHVPVASGAPHVDTFSSIMPTTALSGTTPSGHAVGQVSDEVGAADLQSFEVEVADTLEQSLTLAQHDRCDV
jgi:hypothetical protein